MSGQNIQVFVRSRPMNRHEKKCVVEVLSDRREVKVLDRNTSYETKNFQFDQVFDSNARQVDVYDTVVKPLIDQVLMGFNCTVFAYGQTGTGKTYTMEGNRSDENLSWEEDPHCGIIPRAISQLFETLKDHDNEFTIRVSFLELYNEDTYDLLGPLDDTTKLKIFDDAQRKGSVIVGGLEEIGVQSKAEIFDILKRGSAKRQTAATLLNACSSRSHTIFSVTVHIREGSIEGEELLKIGKLNLVDLAGSENIRRSGAQDKRAREAGNINQSLLTLGRVITALVEKRPHVPYRESKLTRLLQDSLGGKTKTSIIATISPALIDLDDTLSTLDYASRAKKITNKPEMNQRLTKKALLREYTNEIERLRRDLQATREKNGVYIDEENYKEMCQQLSSKNTAIQEKEDRLSALQNEVDKSRKLFEDFTARYEQTRAELDKTKLRIKAQQETEEKLIKVAEVATSDIHLLHNKKERIENILREKQANVNKYQPEFLDDMTRIQSLIQLHETNEDSLSSLISKINLRIETSSDAYDSQELKDLRKMSDDLRKQEENLEELLAQCRTKRSEVLDKIDKKCLDLEIRLDKKNQDLQFITKALMEHEENGRETRSTFITAIKRESNSLLRKIEEFFKSEIKEDVITGKTPHRKVYELPRRMAPFSPGFQCCSE